MLILRLSYLNPVLRDLRLFLLLLLLLLLLLFLLLLLLLLLLYRKQGRGGGEVIATRRQGRIGRGLLVEKGGGEGEGGKAFFSRREETSY